MGTPILPRHTRASHRDQRVTIVGVPSERTAGAHRLRHQPPTPLLGLLTVLERDGRRAYHVGGHDEDLADLDSAAVVLAAQCS